MKIIITRHGETEENKAGIMQGHLPGKLSALGISQAKKVAIRLKNEKIDFIFSSDLARASDTAKEIAKFHPNTPIEFTEDLRENYMGKLQGRNKNEINWKEKTKTISSEIVSEFNGGESVKKLNERAKMFLDKALSKHQKDTILVVGHSSINKFLTAIIMNKNYKDVGNQPNTSISIFDIDENKKYKTYILNDISHLD